MTMDNQRFDTMICFTDGNELHIAIGALILKPHKEVILISDTVDSEYGRSIEKLLHEKGLSCVVSLYRAREIDLINKNQGVAVLINECTAFEEYRLLFTAVLHKVKLFYADIMEGQVFPLEQGETPLAGGPVELGVDDVLEVSGYNVQESREALMQSRAISDMLDFVTQNTERWEQLRRLIKNNTVPNGDWTKFGSRLHLNLLESSALLSFTHYLEEKKYLTEKVSTRGHLYLKIPDAYVRTFIQTTGLWLEALTYRALHQFSFIDDAMADVRFLWGEPPCAVSNEIDVMATSDSRMIIISCKDVDSLSTSMLNEIEVYSGRIGGDRVIKLLVTSKKPFGRHVFDRAEAMNIHIVWFGHDLDQFTHILKTVLEKELA